MEWREFFSHNVIQILGAVFLALFVGLLLSKISLEKFIIILVFAAIVWLFYKKFSSRIDSVPVLLLKLLVFSGFIESGIVFARVGPISIFPFRLLIPIVLLIFLVQILKKDDGVLKWSQIRVKYITAFFMFWICYSLISLTWVKALKMGAKEFIFLSLGTSLIFLFVFYFSKLRDYVHLYYIWLAALVILIALGMLENLTGHHLPISRIPQLPSWDQHIPTAVFHNENDYATYLTLGIFFLISFVKYIKDIHFKFYGVFLGVLSLYLIYVTRSRASLLALAVGLLLYFLFIMNPRQKRMTLPFGILAVLIGGVYIYHKISTAASKVGHSLLAGTGGPTSSNGIRINLMRNCFHFISDTFGLGDGSGNAVYYMEHYEIFPTNKILNVHNWWLEILVNYGVFVFVGYVLFFIALIVGVYRALKKAETRNQKMICEALLGGLFVFPIAVISPSSIMTFKFQWIFLAFAVGYINYFRMKQHVVQKEGTS